jgi:hypothetical protein
VFPIHLYKCPGKHKGNGCTFDFVHCADENAEKEARDAGWLSFAEAIEKAAKEPSKEPAKSEPASRAELEAQAAKLNIAFDGRTANATLLKKIEDVLKTRTD